MGKSLVISPSWGKSKKLGTNKRRRISTRRREILIGIVFIMPGLLLAIGFKLIPLVNGFRLSLYRTRGFEDPSYIGLGNYQRLLDDPVVRKAFLTSLFVLASLPIWIILPLILAVLLFQESPGWKFFRASFFLPYIIAPIVIGIMFKQILAVNGPLNRFLRAIGLKSIAIEWLNGQRSALVALVAVAIWSFFGLGVLIYLAALSTIPIEIVESARLDGTGYWRMLMQIILPMIKPTLGYWTVLCASGVLVWMFPLIYALTRGGPGYSTTMPEYLVFLTIFQFLDRGYGSAIGICLFILAGFISSLTVRYMYNEGTRSKK